MASSITSSPYSIASLIASDPIKPKADPSSASLEQVILSEQERPDGTAVLEDEGEPETKSASRCSCFACAQPSAFSPFKNGLGPESEANHFSTISNVRSFADYFYIPAKGW